MYKARIASTHILNRTGNTFHRNRNRDLPLKLESVKSSNQLEDFACDSAPLGLRFPFCESLDDFTMSLPALK